MNHFKSRRQALLEAMPPSSALILTAADHQTRNGDCAYPFRQASDFYYLTGWPEAEAVLLLVKADEAKSILFCAPEDKEKTLWEGARIGVESAVQDYGLEQAFPIAQCQAFIAKLSVETLFASPAVVERFQCTAQQDSAYFLHSMRRKKDSQELQAIRQAIAITEKAFLKAMHACEPGLYEHHIQAELMYASMQAGALHCAYNPIVAGGTNACTLHYEANNQKLRSGDLLLIDFGVEWDCYASDISRTFPVNGKFTAQQKDLYERVLDAQYAAIDAVRPGATWEQLQAITKKALGDWADYFPHGVGHAMGLDVHDVTPLGQDRKTLPFEAGMVVTIEPGVYIPEQGIGIRIEDDILVTDTGCEVLSQAVPKTVKALEEICGG